MATKKQIEARKKFAAAVKAGKFRKKKKSTKKKTAKKKRKSPSSPSSKKIRNYAQSQHIILPHGYEARITKIKPKKSAKKSTKKRK